jgi:hypothetical protein
MKLNDFPELIAPEVIGCPTMTIDRAVVDATRDFCRRTDVWRVTDTQDLKIGVSEYELAGVLPSAVDVSRILSVRTDGEYLRNIGAHLHHNPFSESWGKTHGTYSFVFNADLRNMVRLSAVPEVAVPSGLIVEASLVPQKGVSNNAIDPAVLDRWYEPIVMKAKQLLYMQPGVTWSNPDLSAYYFTMYNKSTAQAQTEGRKEYSFKDPANPEIAPIW